MRKIVPKPVMQFTYLQMPYTQPLYGYGVSELMIFRFCSC